MGSTSRWGRTASLISGLALFVALVAVPTLGLAAQVATVRGTITNSSASTLSGIHVTIQGESSVFYADAVTGAGGSYFFGVPVVGDYLVTVQDTNGVLLTDSHRLTGVSRGIVTSNFTMVRPGGFSGTVTVAGAPTPTPLQQIEVQSLRLNGDFEYWDGTALTDQYGNYAITGAFPGPHTVDFTDVSDRAAPYAPQSVSTVVVEGANTPNVNVALLAGTLLSGRVTDSVNLMPIGSIIIQIQNDATADLAWISTTADGTYSLTGLPAGDYTVSAQSWNDNYVNVSQMVTLASNQVLAADFALAPAATGYITGRAVDAAVLPVGGIEVSLAMGLPVAEGRVIFSTVTSVNGTFSLPPVTGPVTIKFFDATGAHPELVTSVVATGPAAIGDFALAGLGRISGTVTDLAAQPIAGATVFLWDPLNPVAPLDSATTGVSGSYNFGELPVGNYMLSFTADSYQPEYFNNGQTFAGSTVIAVAGNANVANAVLSRPNTLAGMITGKSGLPASGVVVTVMHVGPNGYQLAGLTTTDFTGNFSVGGLVSGDYIVHLSGVLGAGYVTPGGLVLAPLDTAAAHFTFVDSLTPLTQNIFASYTFDTIAPTVAMSVSSAQAFGVWHSQPAAVTLTAADADSPIDQIFYTVDGGLVQVYAGPFDITADGTHTVVYQASDIVGNISAPATQTVVIDAVAPAASIVLASAPPTGTATPTTVTLSAIDARSGVASINYTIDGGATQVYTTPFSITATGTHTVSYWATDNVGNTSAPIDRLVHILVRYEETDARIVYRGTVTSHPGASYSGGSLRTLDGASAGFTVAFNGTAVVWTARTASNMGIAQVTLDGVVQPNVDLFSAVAVNQRDVFARTDLPAGPHTLVVSWTGAKNALSSAPTINIDAIGVAGTLTQGVSITEETSMLIAYRGIVASHPGTGYSGGSLRTLNGANAGFTVAFNGAAITWTARTATDMGIAQVTLDGVVQPNVDLFSAVAVNQQVVFSKTGLSAGPHTLVVSWTGAKNALSSAPTINIDVIGTVGALTQGVTEETSALIAYRGTVTSHPGAGYSGGSLRTLNGASAGFTVAFNGTAVAWTARTASNMGIAQVTLDGIVQPNVDLFSMTAVNKQIVFSRTGLVAGPHTLTVSWTGAKNALSSAPTINIDAIGAVVALTQAL